MTTKLRRQTITASQLRNHMVIELHGNETAVIFNVRHLAHKVLFTANQTEHSFDKDDGFVIVLASGEEK